MLLDCCHLFIPMIILSLKFIVIQILIIIMTNLIFAQQFTIKGNVCNATSKQPLDKANVMVKGTRIGTATDINGEFQILLPGPGIYEIEASHIGFESMVKTVRISDETETILAFSLKESIISIEGVTVQAVRDGIMITNRMTVIDVDEFTKANRVYRLEDLLSRMAGIDVYRTGTVGNPSQFVAMRGFNDLRFVIAVDGRALSGPSHEDCSIDWTALTTDDIEKVEIIRSGSTVLYDGAMGGIVNIVRKKENVGSGFRRPKITGQFGLEALRTKRASCSIRGGIGLLGYYLSGNMDLSSGYLRNERNENYGLSGNLHCYLPGQSGKILLAYKKHHTNMGYPVINDPVRADYDPHFPIVPEGSDLIRKWSDNVYPGGKSNRYRRMDFIDLVYEQNVKNAKTILNLFGNYGIDEELTYSYRDTTIIDSISGDTIIVPRLKQLATISNEYTYGTSFRIEFKNIEMHSFMIGFDYRNLGTFGINKDSLEGVVIDVPEGKDAIPDWYRLIGIFAEDQFKASKNINITLGLRWSYLDEWTMPTYYNPLTGDSGRVHFYYSAVLPKFSASYCFDDSTIIYTSVNREWHIPNC